MNNEEKRADMYRPTLFHAGDTIHVLTRVIFSRTLGMCEAYDKSFINNEEERAGVYRPTLYMKGIEPTTQPELCFLSHGDLTTLS